MRVIRQHTNRRDFNIGAGTAFALAGMPGAVLAHQRSSASSVAKPDSTSGGAFSDLAGGPDALLAQEPDSEALVVHYDVTGWVQRFAVGNFQCLAVSDGSSLNNDPNDLWNFYGLLFGASDPDEVQAWLDAGGFDATNLIRQDTCLLVDTGDQLVLIDTGIGPASGGALLSNLEGAGVAAEDIDVIINTHGHPDHIGGNTGDSGAPAFPSARYVMAQEEWDFWADESAVSAAIPNAAIQEVVLGFVASGMLPISDRFDLIGFEEEIVPGMTSIASPGHTPGHMSVLVQSDGEALWVGGDFATHPVDMRNPSFAGYADIDPEQMEATRRRMFNRMAEGGLAIFGHFDPFAGLGHVSADGNAWVWTPAPNDE